MDTHLRTIIISCLLSFVLGRYITDQSQESSSLRRRRSDFSSSPYRPHILLNNDEYFRRKYYNTLDDASEEDGEKIDNEINDNNIVNTRRVSVPVYEKQNYEKPIVVVPLDRASPKVVPTSSPSPSTNNINNNIVVRSTATPINSDLIKRFNVPKKHDKPKSEPKRYPVPIKTTTEAYTYDRKSFLDNHIDYHEEEHHSHPRYKYRYSVNDLDYLDVKSHREERDGDHTVGEYSVLEPDGTILTVRYTVNGDEGFNAVVSRSEVHQQDKRHLLYEENKIDQKIVN